jgi:hypothetical protein
MSVEYILQKIKREPRILPPTDEPPKLSKEAAFLLGKINTKRWIKQSLLQLDEEIMNLDAELHFLEHIPGCEFCKVEFHMSVERYLGTIMWWTNLEDEPFLQEIYPDIPKAKDYDIGCYADSSEDTYRFIEDRRKWVHKLVLKQFKAACKLVHILEDWNVSDGIPENSWIKGMIAEVGDIPPTTACEGCTDPRKI